MVLSAGQVMSFFFHANPTKGIKFPLLRNNGNRYNQVLNYYKRITHAAYC
jgi:hypothetical protein